MITPQKKEAFYKHVREVFFHGTITQQQFEGIEAILNEFNRRQLTDLRWLAYILATVFHETGGTFAAIEEGGRGKGRPYGTKLKMGGGPGKRIPYKSPDKLYYGRGLVQITWFENYSALGRILKIDLLNQPELALRLDVAVQILFIGMLTGLFTGRRLSQVFNDTVADWAGARGIINGSDKAVQIAWYGKRFYSALV